MHHPLQSIDPEDGEAQPPVNAPRRGWCPYCNSEVNELAECSLVLSSDPGYSNGHKAEIYKETTTKRMGIEASGAGIVIEGM